MAAQPAPAITVHGNVEGSVVVGDNNFVVNTNHGTIVYQQAAPRVQARTMTPRPPRRPRGFVGRERELAQLESWISNREPVYLHGQPGAGKTTLAKQAANSPAAASQPDGVVFIEGLTETAASMKMGDLVQRLFDALFDSEPHLKVDIETARSYLSNRQPLVFISSIALAPSNLTTLADLFPNAPILVETEQWIANDIFSHMALSKLDRGPALQLFAERCGLPLEAENQPILSEIAALVDEIPAALVTVANAIRENRFGLPDAASRLREFRQERGLDPLNSAYALVLDGLTDPEREMLIQAGAAPGISIDREWLESVSGGKPVSERLESLGLLQANSPRLRLSPGLRGLIQVDHCFYGPGRMYLSFTGIKTGAPIEVIGRNDAGDWVYVQFPSAQDPKKLLNCWFESKTIKLDGELLRLEPVYPDKAPPPISQNPVGYPGLKNVAATRSGNKVTITWDANIIPDGDRFCKECALYLVEAWVCQAGKIVFIPMGIWGNPIATIADEPGCSEPSHGRVFLSEKHGYIGPVEIEWPQP